MIIANPNNSYAIIVCYKLITCPGSFHSFFLFLQYKQNESIFLRYSSK